MICDSTNYYENLYKHSLLIGMIYNNILISIA